MRGGFPAASRAPSALLKFTTPPADHSLLAESLYTTDNLTRGTTLATSTRIAGTSAARRRGLLATDSMRPGDGLWIAPCEAIHTLGMKWPIDAIFLDKSYRVRKLSPRLPPWRIAVCWTAASVLELPAGVLLASGTQVGDELAFHPTSH